MSYDIASGKAALQKGDAMNTLITKGLCLIKKVSLSFRSRFDGNFAAPDVPLSKIVSHQKWQRYLYGIGNKPGMRILEIGSREVTAQSTARKEFVNATYVGFDYYAGNNVDVVGDAHKLSSYFKEEEKFDIGLLAVKNNIRLRQHP